MNSRNGADVNTGILAHNVFCLVPSCVYYQDMLTNDLHLHKRNGAVQLSKRNIHEADGGRVSLITSSGVVGRCTEVVFLIHIISLLC